jgi:hypothetical protein
LQVVALVVEVLVAIVVVLEVVALVATEQIMLFL